MANKKMRSYRLDDETYYSIRNAAEKFGMTDTDVVRMAVDWLYDCGAVYALEDVKREGIMRGFSASKALGNAAKDGEIIRTVKAKCWTNCNGVRLY